MVQNGHWLKIPFIYYYFQKYKFGLVKSVISGGHIRGWSGIAMVLGKLPVPGRPTIWITVGPGPTVLAVGAGAGCLAFLLSSILSFLFLPLFGRRPDIE